ncbi:MAG: hypothetical protein K2O78_03105 [Muribaculaceae bacterium]|nr:hypothetical protein [Muribaculaceae bacterium]
MESANVAYVFNLGGFGKICFFEIMKRNQFLKEVGKGGCMKYGVFFIPGAIAYDFGDCALPTALRTHKYVDLIEIK